MPVSPQEIAHREFFTSRNGYDKEEVRAFLNVVARNQSDLLDRVNTLASQGDGIGDMANEVTAVLQNAGETAERLVREAEAKAAEIRVRAEEEADGLRRATADSTDRLKEEAEQYAYDVRTSAERAARDQQVQTVDRVGRLLAGESSVRERLYALELTLQSIRGELKGAAEDVYPELSGATRSLPEQPPAPLQVEEGNGPPVIDLRENSKANANGSVR
jgi:DivIVA domain-containing protein